MFLPQPPSVNEKLLYLDSGRKKLYVVSATSTAILLIGMLLFLKTHYLFIPYLVFSVSTIIYLLCTYAVGLLSRDFNYPRHTRLVTRWLDRSFEQEIDILLPVCGEPIEVLKNTWKGVSNLCIAQAKIPSVYVLDDGKSKEVEALAHLFKFNYITRETNELKKAGNLRNAFKLTKAPYFVIFDADFVPRNDFIFNLMPYFYEDQAVGIVQSTQFFEVNKDQTRVQNGAGSIQELFYRLIQTSRDCFNGSICVGSNAIYSRKHLEQFGGTAAIGYSEDVRTGFRLTNAGSKVRYVPLNLAKGLCPENWKQFFTQYYRWSMGSIDLMLSKEFWISNLTFMQRVCYLSGMLYYVTTGLSVIFYFMPSFYLLTFKPEYIHWYNLIFSLPSLFLTTVYMRFWQKLPYSFDTIRVRHVANYAHLIALKDRILDTLEEWKPTNTSIRSKRYDSFCVFYIFMTLAIPLVTFILIGWKVYEGHSPSTFLILGLLTIYNAFIAIPVIDDL